MDCLGIRKDAAITILVVWPMKERIMLGRPQRIYLLTFLEVPNSLHACNICRSSQISGRATIPRRSSLFITYAFIFIVVIQVRCDNQSNNFRIEESESFGRI
jgi:hypothetical protein